MKSFRERLRYDAERGEYLDNGIRYMMIRPDALMGILHELDPDQHMPFMDAFARSIMRHGSKSAKIYQAMGAADSQALLETIRLTAPELGWGRWRFAHVDGGLDLTIENSPFAHGHGPSETPVCSPIAGMLRAVGSIVLDGNVTAVETECAAMTGIDACRFEVRDLKI